MGFQAPSIGLAGDNMDFSFALDCINSFPYWPELITLFSSLALALVTSKLAARSEVQKAYREKRVETYDELISFLDAFRENPDWALCPDFYSKSLVLSNHARVYGSIGVQDAMRTMLTSLNKDYESYKRASMDLYDKYLFAISHQPDAEHSSTCTDQVDDLDAHYKEEERKLRNSYRKSEREVFNLVLPVLRAIRDSVYSGRK